MANPVYKGKYVSRAAEIPKGEHWAIVRESSVFVPGDERSRTAPGHGYPERTEHFITYQVFTSEEEFKAAMEAELKSGLSTSFQLQVIRGIHVTKTYGAVARAEIISEG